MNLGILVGPKGIRIGLASVAHSMSKTGFGEGDMGLGSFYNFSESVGEFCNFLSFSYKNTRRLLLLPHSFILTFPFLSSIVALQSSKPIFLQLHQNPILKPDLSSSLLRPPNRAYTTFKLHF